MHLNHHHVAQFLQFLRVFWIAVVWGFFLFVVIQRAVKNKSFFREVWKCRVWPKNAKEKAYIKALWDKECPRHALPLLPHGKKPSYDNGKTLYCPKCLRHYPHGVFQIFWQSRLKTIPPRRQRRVSILDTLARHGYLVPQQRRSVSYANYYDYVRRHPEYFPYEEIQDALTHL